MKRFIVGLIISLVALWWAFRGLDWQGFREALARGDMGLVLLASVVLLIAIPVRGLRWQLFMRPIKKVSVRLTSEATLIGKFGNSVLPFRLGDLLRSYFVSRQVPAPMSQVLGTVVVERLLDVISVLLILAFLPLMGTIPEQLRVPVQWVVVISSAVAAVTFWAAKRKNFPFIGGRLKTLVENLQRGFASLLRSRYYLPLFVLTVVIWTLYLLSIHIGQLAMGLGLSIRQSYIVLVATSLVISVPAVPGFVGTYHAAAILALVNILAVDLTNAQATAIVLHAIGFIPYTVFGAMAYFWSHMRLRDVRGKSWVPIGGQDL